MAFKRSTEIKVGLVTVSAVILFIVGMSLGTNYSSGNNNSLKFIFARSGGIEDNAPVFVNGVKRGMVTDIMNYNDSVMIAVSMEDISDIYSDAAARISMLELTGGKKIDISPGTSGVPVSRDGYLRGLSVADMGEMLTLFSDISDETSNIIKRLDTMTAVFVSVVNNDEFDDDLSASVSKAANTIDRLHNLVETNYSLLDESIKNIHYLTRELKTSISDNRPRAENILYKIDSLISSSDKFLDEVKTSYKNADTLMLLLKNYAHDFRDSSGLAYKLLYDRQFAQRIDSALSSLKQMTDQIKEHGINTNVRLGSRP